MSSKRNNHKEKTARRHHNKEEKPEEPELPRYRDRAKERREDQNPDYEVAELTAFHAVAPPGATDILAADAHKLSIEKSKYLGGDVEHTHLVKGLDYALLNKVRSEIDKKPDSGEEAEGKSKGVKDDQPVAFRTATAKSIYQSIVKPQTIVKTNEMFLPGRMAFIYDMENSFSHDIPTTVHRSKADCPVPEEMVTVSVDGSVLERIAKIMTLLRLGSSGKVLKKKKKDRDAKGKTLTFSNGYEEVDRILKSDLMKNQNGRQTLPPPPPLPRKAHPDPIEKPVTTAVRQEEEDIFVGEGIDYSIPSKDMSQSPLSEDMVESPRVKEKTSYFTEPTYGPVPPTEPTYGPVPPTEPTYGPVPPTEPTYGPVPPTELSYGWEQSNGYDGMQAQALPGSYQGEWQGYQYAEQMAYPEQYIQDIQTYDAQAAVDVQLDPQLMTQEEKDRGLGSVFKRDDERLQHLREKDSREKDPNFISESYSECYPGYQEYNREVVDSDEDADLSKMDMGGRAKGRLHRWDFETEEEWASYNEQKEAMPKAAFQFGVKMQDGRKTRKQNRDQKLTNDLHKINKILARKKGEGGENNDDGTYDDDESHHGKKIRV